MSQGASTRGTAALLLEFGGLLLDGLCLLVLLLTPDSVLRSPRWEKACDWLQMTLNLHQSCRYGKVKLLRFLVRRRSVSPTLDDASACGNNIEALRVLLQHNPELATQASTFNGRTLAHIAASRGHDKVIAHLLDTYLVAALHLFSKRDKEGWQPFHTACLKAHPETVCAFITFAPESLPNPYELLMQTTAHGDTGLSILARNGEYALIQLIITKIKDDHLDDELREVSISRLLGLRYRNKKTLCHIAAEKGSVEFLSFLISYGADVLAIDSLGRTPLYCAAESNHPECVALLCRYDGEVATSAAAAARVAPSPAHSPISSPFSPSSSLRASASPASTPAPASSSSSSSAEAAGMGPRSAPRAWSEPASGDHFRARTCTAAGLTPLSLAKAYGFAQVVEVLAHAEAEAEERENEREREKERAIIPPHSPSSLQQSPGPAGSSSRAGGGKGGQHGRHRYFLLHKPVNSVCSTVEPMVNDLRGVRYYRPTVYDVVKSRGFPSDVNPVGRLDNATDGIMLFTDDSELAAAVRNPPKSALEAASEWKRKEYVLVLLASPKHALDKNRSPADLELLERSMEQPLEFSHHGRRFVTGEVSRTIVRIERVYQDLNYAPSRAVGHPSGVHQALGWCLQCRVTLSEGKHHQIRRIASRAKFIVLSLTRARICSVLSVDSVPCPGDCRWLSQGELEVIRQGLGLKERPAAESGEQATEEEEG